MFKLFKNVWKFSELILGTNKNYQMHEAYTNQLEFNQARGLQIGGISPGNLYEPDKL